MQKVESHNVSCKGFDRVEHIRRSNAATSARRIERSPAASQNTASPIVRTPDSVEVSQMATYLGKMKMLPAVRQNLIDSVRERIANGTYETPEMLDAAIEQFMRDER